VSWYGSDSGYSAWRCCVGVRRQFRKVALSTQETAPDTMFFLFFIPGSLGAKDGGNVLWYL
jgi:hypothetical protein